MHITKRRRRYGTTNPHHREISREHLALKITKLMPWQISKIPPMKVTQRAVPQAVAKQRR
ncbi:Lipase, class 3 [Gossypium australe]|uniref:Lipase, class 3 n=1 Tax=Gossypium australe TaxID=47621 RepID=A0A5B6VL97_9ROSI|nr:Lipase, class 3 [Gossypium australe]